MAVRILSIDGGGIRGLVPAAVLDYLEKKAGKPCTELFDLIAGTSTGGILGCGLCVPGSSGSPKYSAADLIDLYAENGETIFSRSLWDGFRSMGSLTDEKYPSNGIEDLLHTYFGNAMLSESLCKLLVTSYDIKDRKPHFFKNWRARGRNNPSGESKFDRDFLMRDVCRATSAAPTYFEPARIFAKSGKEFHLIDGGVFANNPGMCAVSSASRLFDDEQVIVLSLGTGETIREIPYEKARGWGLIGWARPLLYILFDGVSDAADYHLSQMLGRNHLRIQARLEKANDDMDDAGEENINLLKDLGKRLVDENKIELDRFADILAA